MLVDAVLEAPQPRGARTDQRVCARVGDRQVLGTKFTAGSAAVVPLDHLRLAKVAVGVLREDRALTADDAQRVAHAAKLMRRKLMRPFLFCPLSRPAVDR